ncbi:hypothetical protein EC991_011328 [Linnemannia zychae]|nr:hypothetical protein EC991_011328 [Linnemannia zychae]
MARFSTSLLRSTLFLLTVAFLTFLTISDTLIHSTLAAPISIPGHVYRRRALLSTHLALPGPHRRFDSEAKAEVNNADAPNISVRHDVEEVEKRGLPPGSGGRPGSGSNYDKGKPFGRREEGDEEAVV